jgi:hypothetical protein
MVCVKNRSMVEKYKGKLSSKGYFISINDNNKTLPNGTFVESGMNFRNNFHLKFIITLKFLVKMFVVIFLFLAEEDLILLILKI